MPELPDVEGFRRLLEATASGRRIRRVEIRDAGVIRNASPTEFSQGVSGHRFGNPSRKGKWLVVPLEGGEEATLLMHFGMTGSLIWSPARTDPHPHDRVIFVLDGGRLSFRDQRKLQGLWLAAASEKAVEAVTGRVGPDALGLSGAELSRLLGGSRRALKAQLMDQTVIAGLGNLASDEILWRAGVSPALRYDDLDKTQRDRLRRALQSVLRTSVREGHIPASRGWLTAERGSVDPHCPRCATPLRSRRLAGRRTLWCPSCQPE